MERTNDSHSIMKHAFAFFLILLAFAARAAEPDRIPPNIVFVLADDLGWADLGCYGSDFHETPHLDRLAAEGIRFTDAYAAAAICSPTRAAILTGKHPARLRFTIHREATQNPPQNRPLIPPVCAEDVALDEVTIPEALGPAGYRSAHVGKWHISGPKQYPENQGFEVNIGALHWGAPPTFFYPYRGYYANDPRNLRYVPDLEFGEPGEYLTDRLTTEAIRCLERINDGPFFLHLAYYSVHVPIEAKRERIERFEKKLAARRARGLPEPRHDYIEYAAMLSHLDENVGRLLEALERLGVADHTVIVFTSDNGGFEGLEKSWVPDGTDNHPLRSAKGSHYEGGLRVPLIVRWPGIAPSGTTCAEPVSSIDFYPTLLEIAGVSGDDRHNASIDGVSLLPLIRDPSQALPARDLFFHYPHYHALTPPVSTIRSGNWKLIDYHEGDAELYHLKKDLSEMTNLGNRLPEKVDELRGKLDAWRRSIDAQMPKPNANFPEGNRR